MEQGIPALFNQVGQVGEGQSVTRGNPEGIVGVNEEGIAACITQPGNQLPDRIVHKYPLDGGKQQIFSRGIFRNAVDYPGKNRVLVGQDTGASIGPLQVYSVIAQEPPVVFGIHENGMKGNPFPKDRCSRIPRKLRDAACGSKVHDSAAVLVDIPYGISRQTVFMIKNHHFTAVVSDSPRIRAEPHVSFMILKNG